MLLAAKVASILEFYLELNRRISLAHRGYVLLLAFVGELVGWILRGREHQHHSPGSPPQHGEVVLHSADYNSLGLCM